MIEHPQLDVVHRLVLHAFDERCQRAAYNALVDRHAEDDTYETGRHQQTGDGTLMFRPRHGLDADEHLRDYQSESEPHHEQGESHTRHAAWHQDEGPHESYGDDYRSGEEQGADSVTVDQLHSDERCDGPSADQAEKHPAGLVERCAVRDHHEQRYELEHPETAESCQEHP